MLAPQCQHRERRQHARPRAPPDRTSRPESPAIVRMPDRRGCNGKPLCQPSQPPHEYGPGIRPKDATDKEARTPRSRGRSVEQGCAGTAPHSERWIHCLPSDLRWIAPPVCPDLIYDRHPPHSVALMQLRFASLAVISSRWDFHPQECAHAGRTKEKPPAVSCRGLSWRFVRRSGSEVALNAKLELYRVLVLELVDGRRLGSRRAESGNTGELLVEVEPHDFGRERQVLDGSPSGDHTELRDVEVRVTGVSSSLTRATDCVGEAILTLCV